MKNLKLFLLSLLLMAVGQITAVNYSPSPSGWTGKPSSDLTEGSTTWIAATSSGEYIQMKVVDNGNNTVTFYAKKSTGNSFINSVTFRVYKDPSISGSTLNDHGKAIGQGKATAGDTEMSFTMTPDFTSGSHTYILYLCKLKEQL